MREMLADAAPLAWPVDVREILGVDAREFPPAAARVDEFRAQARPQPSQGNRRLSDLSLDVPMERSRVMFR